MKTENKTSNPPLITDFQENKPDSSEKKKRFTFSIRKINILPNIRNYILRKFQSNTVKHVPSPYAEIRPISSSCEKIRLAAKKIEQENIKAIDYCKELSDDEKVNYLQLNKLGSAILTHPNYSETIGLFRTSGNALERDRLVSHLASGKSLNEYFLNKDIIDIKILTSAYKKLAANLIAKNIHSLEELPESIHNLATAVEQKSALLKEVFTHSLVNQGVQKQLSVVDSKIQHVFLSLTKTPLTLQLAIPLFAEITKNQQTNKMDAYNLATCFAPNLISGHNLSFDALLKSNRTSTIYLEALINHDLKLQSYDS